MTEKRETGTVKMYNDERGFGFIAWGGGKDAFVSQRDLERAGIDGLRPGDRVTFTIREGPKGPQAEHLALAEGGGSAGGGGGGSAGRSPATPASGYQSFRPETSTDFTFGPDYLAEGYFETRDGRRYARPELLDSLAIDVAKHLGNQGMKSHQLRRIFNKARGIEARLARDGDFHAARVDITGLKRDAAYQVGRGVVPRAFHAFIERNVEQSSDDRESFEKGFMQHFESVLAYFVYYFREQ